MAAIQFVGQATGVASATLPSHQAGDLVVAFAFRDGSTTAPTLPSGWTDLNSGGINSCGYRVGYRVAVDSSTVSGTWTNATALVLQVYRNARGVGQGGSGSGVGTNVDYIQASPLTIADGSSWVAGFAGHRSVDTSLQTAPAGMTARATFVDATNEAAGHDTAGGVAGWSTTTVSSGGTSSGWLSHTREILARRDLTLSADSGSFSVIGFPGDLYGVVGTAGYPAPLPHLALVLQSTLAYTLAAAHDTYSVAGQAAGLRVGRVQLAAAQGTYAVTGQDSAGTVSVRGQVGSPAPLPHLSLVLYSVVSRTLTADQGSCSVTGQDALFKYGRGLAAAAGAYSVLGSPALRDFEFKAAAGSAVVLGQQAALVHGRALTCALGFYSFAGQASEVGSGRQPLAAATGTHELAGQAAQLKSGRKVAAGQGAVSVVGQAASLRRALRFRADQGTLSVSGNAALLEGSAQADFVVTAQHGSLSVSGFAADMKATRRLRLDSAAHAVTGFQTTLAAVRRFAAGSASYQHLGSVAPLLRGQHLYANAGSHAVAGQVAFLDATDPTLFGAASAYSVAGFAATLRRGTSIDPAESRTFYVPTHTRRLYVPVTK